MARQATYWSAVSQWQVNKMVATVANASQTENQPFLNGIRGSAALYVLVAHCAIWGGGLKLPDPKIAVNVFVSDS
jgi:peptidoglycan/LPS O-acetylase OafA/YrhL